ncbi:MAG: radical SAM protein [Candidatus Scalindua rubra]|uniref:Molybdopterin cofactor synthesis protein MoaA n=1 Tax=Candidatus Scalindua brodae TaxID=237368 RepID=A0A0B0EIW7_9BACT|nr:MAG: molybdopterin cofactor synthesis protein MoaA [Candidatus Scalindua brodae]MBZ0110152.1 radical SAM protein [Candidatus Scalindua rubra]
MPSDWSTVSVDMEITNQCGSECLMCPRESITRPKGMMSDNAFKIVSDKFVREGSLITFSGMGDPLSHPRVFEWISGIRSKSCDVGIVINPASLNKEISQKLIESRPNSITISFPSIQKEVFEKLCPTVLFEDALKRTLELVDLSRGKVGLRITGITTEINSDEQKEYVSFWKVRDIRAAMTACHGRGGNLKDSDIYELKTSGPDSVRCGLFQFHTFVTWEAEVLSCCHDLTGATRIGNLINDDVSVIAERKLNILKDTMPFPVCRQCDEPLRLYPPPQGSPPKSRKERIRFFRSISRDNLS